VGKAVIEEVERKRRMVPNPRQFTIETVLITGSLPTEDLLRERHFNRILQLDDLLG